MKNSQFVHINLGHVLTILSAIIATVVSYQRAVDRSEHDIATVKNGLVQQKLVIDDIIKSGIMVTVTSQERRLVELEKLSGDVREMKADIKWIRSTLKQSDFGLQ